MSEQERILVCVSASPTNADVIRRAAALSTAIDAELIAVYVEDVELRDEAQAHAVHDHLSLAEKHGAMLTTIYGNDPATAIAEYARVSGITKIVLGKSPGRRTRDTLMARLNELAPNLEIIIIPNRLTADANPSRLKRLLGRERFSFGDLAKTALILAACTGMGFLFSAVGLAITNVVLKPYILRSDNGFHGLRLQPAVLVPLCGGVQLLLYRALLLAALQPGLPRHLRGDVHGGAAVQFSHQSHQGSVHPDGEQGLPDRSAAVHQPAAAKSGGQASDPGGRAAAAEPAAGAQRAVL